ncbi:cytochrome P450 [Leptothoe kymatousa]|uniref:Cytochrome P450 n=1 Tax=Leptothoe kymatousa TAU-MAC 1615 TaxID=2364775 RepID=A0ABS5Y2N0_9CYAN|nr:cytochrome P450 [Leptothoe kymatousa]MBT9312056.1 cytochrome P450 [Leptothoe kymatousa TAU-MAC 1615]
MLETIRPLNQLPSPKANFLLGHSSYFSKDPLQFLCDCQQQYDGIIPLRLGFSQACFIADPSLILEVLRERTVFTKGTPGWESIRTLVGRGLLGSDGDFWARQRQLTQPIFHQQRIVAYSDLMVKATEKLLTEWQDGATRDVHEDMMHLTLDVVMQTLLGIDIEGQAAQAISHALDLSMEWFSQQQKQGFLLPNNFPFPLTRRYFSALREMDAFIYELIQQRRSSQEDTGDLLSMLLQVKDEDGSQMSDRQLRDELATLVLAGHETTANALAWTWMLLAQNPDAEAKLHEELDRVLQGRSPTMADIAHLTFTQNVLKESMRLYPPVVLIARSADRDYVLDGCEIPEKCIVLISPWVMQRSEQYFEQPLAFKPERWENNLEKQLPKGVYIPFGEGPRICIGKGFAQMEATLLLATLAQQYQLRLMSEQPVEALPSITLRPKHGLLATLHKRMNLSQ